MRKPKLLILNLYFKHFLVCTAGFVVCCSLNSRIIVPSCRTGTSSEIRNDNLQVTFKNFVEEINIVSRTQPFCFHFTLYQQNPLL